MLEPARPAVAEWPAQHAEKTGVDPESPYAGWTALESEMADKAFDRDVDDPEADHVENRLGIVAVVVEWG